MAKSETVTDMAVLDTMSDIEKAVNVEGSWSGLEERKFKDEDLLNGNLNFHGIVAAYGNDVVSSKEAMPSLDVLNGEDKQRLVGVPFFAIDWTFRKGDQGMYVSIRAVTEDNNIFLLNDGSSGIYQQFLNFSEQSGKFSGLFCRNGLRRSDYEYQDPQTGESRPATTFYVA